MSGIIYVATPDVEQQRLREFGWPHVVSAGILDKFKFEALLDAGCGVSPALGQYVSNRGSGYVGVDSGVGKGGEALAHTLADEFGRLGIGNNAAACVSDIRGLPISKLYDLTHTRFVLAHNQPGDRAGMIEKLLVIAKRAAIFMEYDWSSMASSADGPVLDDFVGVAQLFATLTGMQLDTGKFLPGYFSSTSGVELVRFSRPEADYTSELIALCEVIRAVSAGKGWILPMNRARIIQETLQARPISFVPADIVAAIVRK